MPEGSLVWVGRRRRINFCRIKVIVSLIEIIGEGGGEVDIVCEKEGIVVFVEVKSRRTDLFGEPFEAVDKRKRRHIARSAKRWLYERKLLGKCDVRFDVVSIVQRDGKEEIAHIEDAFRP